MTEVNVHEAKTRLSALLRRGCRRDRHRPSGKPVAQLVPMESTERRQFGSDIGRFTVPDDFDAELPDDLLAAFES